MAEHRPDYEEIARLERELAEPLEAAAALELPALGRRRCRACGNTWPRGLESCNHCGSEEWWIDENG